MYVTTQRYDNTLREFNEIKGNINININEIDSQTINSEVNIDITMMKSNNLKIVETPGYIRQLHGLIFETSICKAYLIHFPSLNSHANPPLGTEAFFATILTGNFAHTSAGSEKDPRPSI